MILQMADEDADVGREDEVDEERLSLIEQGLARGFPAHDVNKFLDNIASLKQQGFSVSDREYDYLTLPPERRKIWVRERHRVLNFEKKLAESQGRELSPDETYKILKRVTDQLNTASGELMVKMRTFSNNFDRGDMSTEDISNTKLRLRGEFWKSLYEDMTETEVMEIRAMQREYYNSTASPENLADFDRRQKDRRAQKRDDATRDQLLEQGRERNARKKQLAEEAGISERERPASFRGIGPVRSRVVREIVQPRFQVPRHIDDIVRDLHTRNPEAVPLTMLAQATRLSSTPRTGVTFFPPQNANPTIVYPWRTRFSPPTRQLPSYMNWGDSSNVAAVRGWTLPRVRLSHASRLDTDKQGYLHEVVDQLGCGSCWVISVAGAMSDRASIWTQEPNPQLSITNILGCVSGDGDEGAVVEGAAMYSPATAGCAGGIPMGAVEMLANFGDATSTCVGYEWCENDPVCSASKRMGFSDAPAYLNSKIPACAEMLETCIECENGQCGASETPRAAWGLKSYPSGRPYILLTDILSIKQEIAAHGPVVATHAIFGDFQAGTTAIVGDGWAKTHGVYCNVQTSSSLRPYNGTRYVGSERQLIGYHAVVIVGWGVETGVPDWQHPGDTRDIPYWIIRNSWSTAWNSECMVNGMNMPGYCKIALTDPARNINTKLYLDNAEDGMIGAAIAFMPMVTRVEPKRSSPSQVDENPDMHEEKIVDDTPVTLASASRDDHMVSPDSDEIARDQINHPIPCTDNTPPPSFKLNCEGRAASSRLATQTGAAVGKFSGVLILLIVIIIALVAILVIRRRGF